ncbi:GlxA family transcriptional regulator [Arthrobacter sp. Sa2BUA2]|uniref:GlxA family transcriptional regulator n=1 Tax=Arthrobacter pullicola TaxID=2762224 RepID=A0ABR8YFD9_9MICC|nr:GlxA family transcriptional regulator [Arthrobacter pullicola]MBD8042699.1 GlxA family transcriptional regulator [Arthrobacter pullicola]
MESHSMAVVAYHQAELLDIACITTPLFLANHIGQLTHPYRVHVLAPGGTPVRCATGLTLSVDGSLEKFPGPVETMIVAGGTGHEEAAATGSLLQQIRRLAASSSRVASVCTGASILAAAGLLDGRRATTHWRFAPDLAGRFPRVTVDPAPIYIRDGKIATAAGVTSALDLTLSFIQEDHGAALARQVARDLVTYLHRPGDQAQMSVFVAADNGCSGTVHAATRYVAAHLADDLSTPAIASHVGVSGRHLSRLFQSELGMPPARFVRSARLDAAARLLESGQLPVAVIARRCGFSSADQFRQCFAGQYALPPSKYRSRFSGPDTAGMEEAAG